MNFETLVNRGRWLALDKPPGISCHNEKGNDVISFVKDLGHSEVYLCNRLDQGTSGIVIVALDKSCASEIQKQFAERLVKKTYQAVCHRTSKAPEESEGVVKLALTKKAEGRKNPRGWAGARVPCETSWKIVLDDGERITVSVEPKTGRKHQIRRHLALLGMPIVGDRRYGIEDEAERMYLAAVGLRLVDPIDGDVVELRSNIAL